MKKMSVCIPLFCKFIASVTLLFVSLYFSATIKAQSEKQDSAFKKWEVSFDLKPLFRSDQPYNVFIARNLTEKKAIRLGLSVVNWNKTVDTTLTLQYNGGIIDTLLLKSIGQYQPQSNTQLNWKISLGYRYEFLKGKISLYTCTDIYYQRGFSKTNIPLPGIKGDTIQTATYLSIYGTRETDENNTFGLQESLGLRYEMNKNLSFTVESSFLIQYTFFNNVIEKKYFVNPYSITETGKYYNIVLKPFMGLYLNYHF